MTFRRLFPPAYALALMCVSSLSAAQVPEGSGKLPIAIPTGATVNFEADAPGSDLLPMIRQLLDAGVIEGGGRPETIVIKTGIGNIEMRPRDIAELLRPVRELHIVSYSLPKDAEDPIRRQETLFGAEGLHRVANDNGFLLMRRTGDHYAVVLHQHDMVTVLRIEGMPNLGVATNVVLRSLAAAAQHASKDKSSGS